MKRAREMTPLWVWIAFILMAIATVAYLAGYVMLEDIIAFVKQSES